MDIKAMTRAGSAYNEDKFNCGDNWFLLLDGATSLSGDVISQYKTNAVWLVEKISYFVENNIEKYKQTKDLLEHMETFLIKEFNELGVDFTEDIEPTASLVLVRELDGYIEVTTIGDASTIVCFKDNHRELIHDTRVKELDKVALDEMIAIADADNISIREARPRITDILLENRIYKNKEDGYCVISVFNNMFESRLTNVFDKQLLDKMYVFTDGVAHYYETLGLASDFRDFVGKIENKSILDVISDIREVENADMDYNEFPRFKKSDDATLGIIKFN